MAPIILIPNNLLQRVIGREQLYLMLVHQMPHLKQWHAHLDAQGFDFVAAGDDTTVVVAEHSDRFTDQVGPKYPFAANVEIVAIDQTYQPVFLGNDGTHTA